MTTGLGDLSWLDRDEFGRPITGELGVVGPFLLRTADSIVRMLQRLAHPVKTLMNIYYFKMLVVYVPDLFLPGAIAASVPYQSNSLTVQFVNKSLGSLRKLAISFLLFLKNVALVVERFVTRPILMAAPRALFVLLRQFINTLRQIQGNVRFEAYLM